MKKETAKRVIALLICVWMTVSMLPTVAMATEGADAYTNGDDSGVTALDDESGGIPVEDEKPNTDIKVIPSDANALILMDTGAQSPQGVPGQVHGGGVVRVQDQRVRQQGTLCRAL